MNLADLEKEFWGDQREQPTRVRLARVVKALRDEVRVIHVDQFSMEKLFDEILAGAGEEKVAGDVNPDGARISGLETTAPAASGSPAAAPDAVCEWAVERGPYYETGCGFGCSTLAGDTLPRSKFFCAQCSRPIKFVDAAR